MKFTLIDGALPEVHYVQSVRPIPFATPEFAIPGMVILEVTFEDISDGGNSSSLASTHFHVPLWEAERIRRCAPHLMTSFGPYIEDFARVTYEIELKLIPEERWHATARARIKSRRENGYW